EASFINNYEVLHARTGFVDRDEPAKKRLLYRLWLEGRPPRPMVPEVQLYRNRSGRMGVDPQPGRNPAIRRQAASDDRTRPRPRTGNRARGEPAARRRPRRLSDRDRLRSRGR